MSAICHCCLAIHDDRRFLLVLYHKIQITDLSVNVVAIYSRTKLSWSFCLSYLFIKRVERFLLITRTCSIIRQLSYSASPDIAEQQNSKTVETTRYLTSLICQEFIQFNSLCTTMYYYEAFQRDANGVPAVFSCDAFCDWTVRCCYY